MNQHERNHAAVDVAARLLPEGVRYCVEDGHVTIYSWESREAVPALQAAGASLDTSDRPGGWYGGHADGIWQREWHLTVDGVEVLAYERHDPAVHGPLPGQAVAS